MGVPTRKYEVWACTYIPIIRSVRIKLCNSITLEGILKAHVCHNIPIKGKGLERIRVKQTEVDDLRKTLTAAHDLLTLSITDDTDCKAEIDRLQAEVDNLRNLLEAACEMLTIDVTDELDLS